MQHLSRQLNKGIVMKTVGEFKKAGLQFVNGDKGDGFCVKAHKYFGMSGVFDNKRATHFAWRENSVVKPEFSGAIDAIIRVGDNVEQFNSVISVDIFSWSLVIKWRPSLNQPSFSEPETKQSAIHKAWMDLQGDLSNAEKHDRGGRFLVVCIKDGISIKKGEYQIASHTTNNTEYWENVCAIPEFTDYCEKMAAEEKRMDIIGQNGNDGLHYGNTAQQVESLAANHALLQPRNPEPIFRTNEEAQKSLNEHLAKLADSKPIFTQAMADNGELPDIGVKCIITPHNNLWGISRLGDYVGEVIYYEGETFVFKLDTKTLDSSSVFVSRTDKVDFKPLDTRTDREKAIDAAFLSVNIDKETIGLIYDIWNCKVN